MEHIKYKLKENYGKIMGIEPVKKEKLKETNHNIIDKILKKEIPRLENASFVKLMGKLGEEKNKSLEINLPFNPQVKSKENYQFQDTLYENIKNQKNTSN